MTVTKLEDFLQVDMERNQALLDMNGLYKVINHFAKVHSSDYRCYVTQKRELVVLFLVDAVDIDIDALKQTILDETVIRIHGIETIVVILDKNAFDAEIEASGGKTNGDLDAFLSPEIAFTLYNPQGSSKLILPLEYQEMVGDIFGIEELKMGTLIRLLEELDANADASLQEVRISDRYLILNTIEVFKSDMTEMHSEFSGKLDAIRDYFFPDSDKTEAIAGKAEKGQMFTLKFLLGAAPEPFTHTRLIVKGREMSIKCYLFFALSYLAWQLQRKVEQSKHLRANRKRHIKYCNEILSGERGFKRMDNIVKYLELQNPHFSPGHVTEDDKANIRELKSIFNSSLEYYGHNLARDMQVLFGTKARRPLNRMLRLMGFSGIGNDTKV